MKRTLILPIASIAITGIIVALYFQEIINTPASVKITINVITENVDDTSTVYISGNTFEFGNWNPSSIALDRDGANHWTKTFNFPVNTVLEFKFTRGSWDKEAADSIGNIPGNNYTTVDKDTTLEFTITNWKDEFEYDNQPQGQITGLVEYHRDLIYKDLPPRDIIVWLPPGYTTDSTDHYPVLYMQDGQNIIDPATASFGVDWQIDECADSLIRKGEIEPIIIVGIYNTVDRSDEYTPTETGYEYIEFIVNKLKPFIDSEYRTKPGREFTAAGGSSAGGIASFMLLWHYNNIFSKAICMSPAFKIDDKESDTSIDYVDDVQEYSGPRKQIKVYIDNGGLGLEQILQPGVDDMLDALKSKGYKSGKDFLFISDPAAEHNEAAWAKRMPDALKFLFSK